jgi:hypothetical protein
MYEDPDRKTESKPDPKLSGALRSEAAQLATFTARLILHLLVVAIVLAFVLIGVWLHKIFQEQYLRLEHPSVEAVSLPSK